MDMAALNYCSVCVLYLLSVSAAINRSELCEGQAGRVSSSFGKEFIFGILDAVLPNDVDRTITLDIVSIQQGHAFLQIPFLHINTTYDVQPGNVLPISVDQNIMKDGVFKESRGIRIQSDVEISVLVTNFYPYASTESYLVFPVNQLGSVYKLASYVFSSSVIVVGTEDNTTVNLQQKELTLLDDVMLDRMEVYQIDQSNDLTGAVVRSDKPIAVISGAGFTDIPVNCGYASHLATQLWPSDRTINSHMFIVPPMRPKAYMIRVMSFENDVNITFKNESKEFSTTLSKTNQTEYYFGNDSVVITSNSQKMIVIQYGVGHEYDGVAGEPLMTRVPGLSQFINEYTFVVPNTVDALTHHLMIIVEKDHVSGLMLDGININASTTITVASPFDNYIVLMKSVSPGFHSMNHSNTSVRYGVLVYGFKQYFGYGYYAGVHLNGCGESSQSVSTASPETIVTASNAGTTQPINQVSTEGHYCFSCEDMTHLEYCDTVKQCQQDEVCFVGRYIRSGKPAFRSGCIKNDNCRLQQQVSATECLECCSGNTCNGKGCGDAGLPNRNERGPICYDCPHAGSPGECQSITVCQDNEICSIEQYAWGSHYHYKMGCTSKLCYPIHRSIPTCHTCCTEDFCNLNCTVSSNAKPGIPEIVGKYKYKG